MGQYKNRRQEKLEQRRYESEERKIERSFRTDQEQLKRLDKMFGKNKGAKKERKRLMERIERNK